MKKVSKFSYIKLVSESDCVYINGVNILEATINKIRRNIGRDYIINIDNDYAINLKSFSAVQFSETPFEDIEEN